MALPESARGGDQADALPPLDPGGDPGGDGA